MIVRPHETITYSGTENKGRPLSTISSVKVSQAINLVMILTFGRLGPPRRCCTYSVKGGHQGVAVGNWGNPQVAPNPYNLVLHMQFDGEQASNYLQLE